MATLRRLDPTTRRFAIEAMIGLVVVISLVALMLHGLVRRFGLMDSVPKPESVEIASVFRRHPPRPPRVNASPNSAMPTPASSPAPDSPGTSRQQPDAVSPPGGSAARAPGGLGENRTTSTPTQATPAVTASGGQASRNPISSDSSSVASSTTRPSGLSDPRQERRPESGSAVPQPFRSVEALPASDSLPSPFAARRETPKTDPRWKIRADDSSWSYCARIYDDPQRFRDLEAWLETQGKRFASLRPGDVLEPPALAQLQQLSANRGSSQTALSASGSEADGVYVTSGAESLFDVAARVLGQAGRYVELSELDRAVGSPPRDPLEPLPAGTRLALPLRR